MRFKVTVTCELCGEVLDWEYIEESDVDSKGRVECVTTFQVGAHEETCKVYNEGRQK